MRKSKVLLVLTALVAFGASEVKAQKTFMKYGEDSISCITHTSLYREFYKQKNIEDALPHWRWVFNNCPLVSQDVYIDGAKIITAKVNDSKDIKIREAYIDTLMMVFENRIRYFGDSLTSRTGMVLGQQAIELENYRPTDTARIYQCLRKSVEREGINSEALIVSRYFASVNNQVINERLPVDSMAEVYDRLSDIVDQKLEIGKNDTAQANKWLPVKKMLDSQFEPYATCDEIEKIYTRKFKQSPDDTTLLKKITRLLDHKECTDRDLFFQATTNLHKARPTGQSAYLMGKLNMIKGDTQKAESYFGEAIPNLDDVLKAKTCYYLAKINCDQNSFNEARSYALKSLALNPADGKCYMLIGNLYAANAASCGGSDEIASRAAYWVAVDKFIKARNVDPSIADEANKAIATYSSYFPTLERLFFNEIKEGSSYNVGCWIGETTIVRASR